MGPEEIIERIWPGRSGVIEPLAGITNRNFKVSFGDERYVLRIAGRNTELLGIDREAERAACEIAADLGIGPRVVAFVQPPGHLVTEFIEAGPLCTGGIPSTEMITRVADSVRRLHSGRGIPGHFDSHRLVETYAATVRDHGIGLPKDHAGFMRLSDQIESARGYQPVVPCHNDLGGPNLLDDGRVVRILDWECAGMGDRFFDLANFSCNHGLGVEADHVLLAAYFGLVRASDFAALQLMRYMSDFREAMWALVQQGISEIDFDFEAYAVQHFDRLRVAASDPGFGSGTFQD